MANGRVFITIFTRLSNSRYQEIYETLLLELNIIGYSI